MSNIDLTAFLTDLVVSGKLDTDELPAEIAGEIMKRSKKEYIAAHHQAAINQGADGRYRTHARDAEGKRCSIAARTLEELEEKLYTFYWNKEEGKEKKKKKITTVGDLAEAWMDSLKNGHLKENTVRNYCWTWHKFLEGEVSSMKLCTLDWRALADALYRVAAENAFQSRAEWGLVLTAMRQIVDFGVETGMLTGSLYVTIPSRTRRHITSIAVNSAARRLEDDRAVFSYEERVRARDIMIAHFHVHDNRTKQPLASLAVVFQMETGLRVGELLGLMWKDVDTEGGTIAVRRSIDFRGRVQQHTKTAAGIRTVPITAGAAEVLTLARAYLDARNKAAPFVFSENGTPLSTTAIRSRYAMLDIEFGKHRTSHAARRTYVSTLMDAHVNLQTVRRVAGHASERTTLQCYLYDRSSPAEQNKRITNALDAVPSCTHVTNEENAENPAK